MRDALARTIAEMGRRDIDALLLGREDNARFVAGATRLWLAGTRPFAPGCVVVRETGAVHLLSITDEGVPAEIPPEHLFPITWNPMSLTARTAAIEGVSSARRVGVDGLSPMFEQLLALTLSDAELVDGDALLRDVRRVKTVDEIESIRAALVVTAHAMKATLDALRPGARERELLGVFEEAMAAQGVTTPAYEGRFCVVDGDTPPRRFPSDRVIENGELVIFDAGVLRDGWEGSFARTVVCGAASEGAAERIQRATDAFTRLVSQIRPGARVGTLRGTDGATVHGVGLGYESLLDNDRLDPGMTISIGVDAAGAVRAEPVLVTDGGCEYLRMPQD